MGERLNPRTAEKWIEAHLYCLKNPSVPAILRREAENKYPIAMRKAIPAKPRIRIPRGARLTPIPKLKKELDRVFSIYIRQRTMNESRMTQCITCGKYAHWTAIQNGHYQSRAKIATRWDEKNCAPQDIACNIFRHGEPEKFAAWIDTEYGPGTAEKLRGEAHKPFKLNRTWLEMKIAEYKGKIKE